MAGTSSFVSGTDQRTTPADAVESPPPKQRDLWLEAVQRNAEHFKKYLSPTPLAWVLTKRKSVTENAAPDGEGLHGWMLPEREAALKRLAEIKLVFLVNDSRSMVEGDRWEQARDALAGLVDITNQHGSMGSDIHFMHRDEFALDMQSKAAVESLFSTVQPQGKATPTGAKVGQIVDYYLPFVERKDSTHEPIAVVVITDALPTDQVELENVVVDAARRLDRQLVRQHMFTLQFVQVGTDPALSKVLRALSDHLVNAYKIRDMVDGTSFDRTQAFDTKYLLRILLGGLHKHMRHIGLNNTSRLAYQRSPRGHTAHLGEVRFKTMSLPSIGVTSAPTPEEEAALKRLAEIKTVFLVEDSSSMAEGDLWEQACEALAGVIDVANRYGSKGSDIHFMHLDEYALNAQSEAEVQALFSRVQPEGADTSPGVKLGQINDRYLSLIEHEGSTHEPITLVVITDSFRIDQLDIEIAIVDAAYRLDRHHVKHDMFGIHFVQIGTDRDVAGRLRKLDDLADGYKIRDMVDSTPFPTSRAVFDTEYMLGVLLGALRKS